MGPFPVRCTGYWPFREGLTPEERRMEGGVKDRRGNPLHTLEQFQAGEAPFVSASGDYTIFPYGQRMELASLPGVVIRIVDTGSHFFGAGKVYREPGREPFDICVASSKTRVVTNTDATLVDGDHLDKPSAAVALDRIGQAPARIA